MLGQPTADEVRGIEQRAAYALRDLRRTYTFPVKGSWLHDEGASERFTGPCGQCGALLQCWCGGTSAARRSGRGRPDVL